MVAIGEAAIVGSRRRKTSNRHGSQLLVAGVLTLSYHDRKRDRVLLVSDRNRLGLIRLSR